MQSTSLNAKRFSTLCTIFILFAVLCLIIPCNGQCAEKKIKKQPPPPAQKATSLSDATLQNFIKRGEEQLKKGDLDGSLRTFLQIHDFTKDALITLKYFQAHYEALQNSTTIGQGEKEDIFLKLKGIKKLISKYTGVLEKSAFTAGYIYSKKGDNEKARKYLTEVLETVPFSTDENSLSMMAKTLLLKIYGLEGEF